MLLLILVWLVSVLFLTRVILIIAGFWKDPILHRFEKYGDEESFLQLSTPMLGWLGVFMITSNLLLVIMWGYTTFLVGIGLLLIVLAILSHEYPHWLGQPYGLVLVYPRWLHELGGRTTRVERRRLAYMWLRLPFKLRLAYNSNDAAFLEWADMVILSSWVEG